MNNEEHKVITNNNTIRDANPEVIAMLFAGLDSEHQARFFNHLAVISDRWRKDGGGGLEMQLQYVTEEDGLNLGGRRVMQYMGDYSHWGLSCTLSRDIP